MASLKDTVRDVVAEYAGPVFFGKSYFLHDETCNAFSVLIVTRMKGIREADYSLTVRIENDLVIVERDQNDKIVLDALLQAGIPREQIILAYAGEPVPEAIL